MSVPGKTFAKCTDMQNKMYTCKSVGMIGRMHLFIFEQNLLQELNLNVLEKEGYNQVCHNGTGFVLHKLKTQPFKKPFIYF